MGNFQSDFEQFHLALQKSDNDKILLLLKNIKSINDYNRKNKLNLLHTMIIQNAHITCIKYAIEVKNCDINEEHDNRTPIEIALMYNRSEIISYLLTKNNLIITHEINKFLIQNGFAPKLPAINDYMFSTCLATVKYAVECNIDTNIINENLDSPFLHAVKTCNFEIVNFLIKYVTINDINQSLYHTNSFQILDLLIINGANVSADFIVVCPLDSILFSIITNYPQHRNENTLFYAIKKSFEITVNTLINIYKIPINIDTILDYANNKSIIKILLQQNATITPNFLNKITDDELWNWIIENGYTTEACTAYYVAKNANIDILDKLIKSYDNNKREIAANYYDPDTLDTCLSVIFFHSNRINETNEIINIIKLIKNINHVNVKKQTLLHIECNRRHVRDFIIIKLLECNIDQNIVDCMNKKAIDYIINKFLKKKYIKLFAEMHSNRLVSKKINCPGCGVLSNKACISFLPKDIECTVCLKDISKMVMIIPCGHTYCCIECYKMLIPIK